MYRAFLFVLAIVLVIGFAGQAQADEGNLSSNMLADMGLSNMQVMSDAQGLSIRGKGFVYAAGWGAANFFGSSATYVYTATDYVSHWGVAAGAGAAGAGPVVVWGGSIAYVHGN